MKSTQSKNFSLFLRLSNQCFYFLFFWSSLAKLFLNSWLNCREELGFEALELIDNYQVVIIHIGFPQIS